jgi:hypothetical protein
MKFLKVRPPNEVNRTVSYLKGLQMVNWGFRMIVVNLYERVYLKKFRNENKKK